MTRELPEAAKDKDEAEQIRGLLLMGWPQQEIEDTVDVGSGRASRYHTALQEGESTPPAWAYSKTHDVMRMLDKSALDIDTACTYLQVSGYIDDIGLQPQSNDGLDVTDVAVIVETVKVLYDREGSKHQVAETILKVHQYLEGEIEDSDEILEEIQDLRHRRDTLEHTVEKLEKEKDVIEAEVEDLRDELDS